jgi:non-reducing end alpha-L-arabinofuranosidase
MVLRDAAGLVVDSLNYGGLVDPWAAEGYQAESGSGKSGCSVPAPSGGRGGFAGPAAFAGGAPNRSAGRYPDGADTDSNCNDFLIQSTTTLSADAAAGATNIKLAGVTGFAPGQTLMIDVGENFETAIIETVGTPGASTVGTATNVGATAVAVTSAAGFSAGQTITIDNGADHETAVVASITGGGRGGFGGGATITVTVPLKFAHASGAQVSGSGITLANALTKAHAIGTQVAGSVPTPGAPNQHTRSHR